jgi:hypothetical protein
VAFIEHGEVLFVKETSRPYACQKCGRICVEKDNFLRGPLEGKYEWLCKKCYNVEGLVRTMNWKSRTDRF